MEHLPDQPHIDRIRDALWRGREFGRAAVVVGAGFSLNARPRSMTATPMPTWAHLASRLIDILYPEDSCVASDRERALEQAKATSGTLRLAEEFQAAFGRESLEAFLKREIPDEAYEPGNLHKLLLKLPWSDVFTTNFDSLLERGKDGLIDRKYDVVRTIAEIPEAMKPRIIKLHGSFPSTRPFIFTEEDFRTYPRQFAPFVNLAQQVIMENVVCLIGFSGDDPNFLYWTGWVRDNLGKSAPYIYLCDLLDLSPARRKMLHDRNVMPIDLSPYFPVEKWPDRALRYSAALEWFLLNLEAGQPPSLVHWPCTVAPVPTYSREGTPSIPKSTCEYTVEEPIHLDPSKLSQAKSREGGGID